MNEDQTEQEASATDAAVTESTGQRPTIRFQGSGGISVAVWKTKNEDGRDRYSIQIDRSYRNADGKYESTGYLRDSDLLRTQQVLGQADAWIEQDKAKHRMQSAASANSR